MSDKDVVLDASMGCRDGLFCFVPVEYEDDGKTFRCFVTGLNFISSTVPTGKRLVGIVHPDGQEAVERFCEEFKTLLGIEQKETK